MSKEINLLVLFKRYNSFLKLIYGKIDSIEFLNDLVNTDVVEKLLNIRKDLQQIEFGSLSFSRKLEYLFFQHVVKEVELLNNAFFTINKSFKIYKIVIKLFFSDFNKQFFLDEKIKKENFDILNIRLKNYLNEITKINLGIIPMDVYTSKNLFSYLNNLISLFIELQDKLGENLTQYEKNIIVIKINSILEKLKEFNKILLNKSSNVNHNLPIMEPKFIEELLKLNGFKLSFQNIFQILNQIKNRIQDRIAKLLLSNFPEKSIDIIFNKFNDQKVISIKNRKQIIEDEIRESQIWLKRNQYFDNPELFPLNIQLSKVLNLEWLPAQRIETITNKNEIKGLKILLVDDLGTVQRKGFDLPSQWNLKQWVFFTLIPGKFFVTKILTDMNRLNVLTSRGEIGLNRWIFLFLNICIRRNYFSNIADKFMSLFQCYYHFFLLFGVIEFFDGKNIEEICFEIHKNTGLGLNKCTSDFYLYYSTLDEKLLYTFESIYLLQIEEIFRSQSLPIQRFADVLIRNINYPLPILKEIFEKSFKINTSSIIIDKNLDVFSS